MGRGKIEIKRIENRTNRQVTFSKRRVGLLKKANELAILCDAKVGAVIFSGTGKMHEYCDPTSSMREIIDNYQRVKNTQFVEIDHRQQVFGEMMRLRSENDKLQSIMRQYTGEDLSTLTNINDVNELEGQLEFSVNKVRERKHLLLHQQVENLCRKDKMLEDENCHLCRMLAEHQMAAERRMAEVPMEFGNFYHDYQSRNRLQLSPQLTPFCLQPSQPNLQESSLRRHGLHLDYHQAGPSGTR